MKDIDKDSIRRYIPQLLSLVLQNAKCHRSDGMVWILYYLHQLDSCVDDTIADGILSTTDCLSINLLYEFDNADIKKKVIQYAQKIANGGEKYEKDHSWILLYQLYKDGQINNPYRSDDCFDILNETGVSFIDWGESL